MSENVRAIVFRPNRINAYVNNFLKEIRYIRRDKFNLLWTDREKNMGWSFSKIEVSLFSNFWVCKGLKNIFPSCSGLNIGPFFPQHACCLNLGHSTPELMSLGNEYQLSNWDNFPILLSELISELTLALIKDLGVKQFDGTLSEKLILFFRF